MLLHIPTILSPSIAMCKTLCRDIAYKGSDVCISKMVLKGNCIIDSSYLLSLVMTMSLASECISVSSIPGDKFVDVMSVYGCLQTTVQLFTILNWLF